MYNNVNTPRYIYWQLQSCGKLLPDIFQQFVCGNTKCKRCFYEIRNIYIRVGTCILTTDFPALKNEMITKCSYYKDLFTICSLRRLLYRFFYQYSLYIIVQHSEHCSKITKDTAIKGNGQPLCSINLYSMKTS